MTNDLFDQLGQTLAQIGRLKEYLHSSIETSDEKVKITIKNTAPEAIDLPKVVFVGVGLSTSGVGLAHFNVIRSGAVQKDAGSTKLHTEKYYRLANQEFRALTTNKSIQIPQDKQQGEILYPGQWIQYEMNIPVEKMPYLEFRVEGIVSPRHLFHGSTVFSLDLSQFKVAAVEALRAYNTFEVHNVLIDVTNHIPAFDGNTRFAEVQAFNDFLTSAILECESLLKPANTIFHKYPFPWFQAHLHATFNYLII